MRYHSMRAFFNNFMLIFIGLFSYLSAMAETPVTHAVQNRQLEDQAIAQLHPDSGMYWQLLPGEDLMRIARLMFPADAILREKFIRAVIHFNPQLFPSGSYQPLTSGTMVQIPNLRTIHAFPAPVSKKRLRVASTRADQPGHSPAQITPKVDSNPQLLQLTTQLERLAENQTQELNALLHHTEALAIQIAAMQSMQAARIQEPDIQHSATELPDNLQPSPTQQNDQFDQPAIDLTLNTPSPEELLSVDFLMIGGALLIVWILIVILRNYRKLQQRLTRSSATTVAPDIAPRHQYEALFMKRDAQEIAVDESLPSYGTGSDMAEEARKMIKQGSAENAVAFLQKQLAIHQFDISGWFLLFELLYSQKNKADFKKNARRFKRLGIFPDIWLQIQHLGHRLEANEPLYFDEQKRQERFFPDSPGTGLASQFVK